MEILGMQFEIVEHLSPNFWDGSDYVYTCPLVGSSNFRSYNLNYTFVYTGLFHLLHVYANRCKVTTTGIISAQSVIYRIY